MNTLQTISNRIFRGNFLSESEVSNFKEADEGKSEIENDECAEVLLIVSRSESE